MNYDFAKLKDLMHRVGNKQVVMIDVGLSHIDHHVPNFGVEIPFVIQHKVKSKIDIKILDVNDCLAL